MVSHAEYLCVKKLFGQEVVMLDIALIKKLFLALNEELSKVNCVGEVGICGGAVMCL